MGQLAITRRLRPNHEQLGRLRRALLNWTLPVLATLAILFGLHTTAKADPSPTETELAQYLQTHQLGVYSQPQGDYQQVFYGYNRQQIAITSANYNHVSPVSSGEYVAWDGLVGNNGQMFLYDVLTDALTQLTFYGTNEYPFIYHNTVTWQGWDGQNWQVFYYDGDTVQQITNDNNSSVRPTMNGTYIIYAEQLAADNWKAQEYNIATGQTTTIRQGDTVSTAYPQFGSDGTITTSFLTP